PTRSSIMSRFSIPIDALTSRMNLGGRFDGLRSTSVSSRFANLRPISEFLDVKRVSKPANFGEVQSRVNFNLGHFASNYAAVFVMLSIYSLLTNLVLLIDICFVVGGMLSIGKLDGNDLQLGTMRASTSQLYTVLFIIAILLSLWASLFTTVLWLIGASGVTVLGHAAFMDKPIEPPGATSGVGRYYEGVEDDVRRFQELDSDDEKNGLSLDSGFQPALHGKNINPDELYFSDMDIGAWEGRASALDGTPHEPGHGYHEQDGGYYDDAGEIRTADEYEEMLFRRVLDKIRLARAAGSADVQMSPQELDAYQARLYGTRVPTARPQPQAQPISASMANDVASVVDDHSTSKHSNPASRSKKSQPRTSIFGSKTKKEKDREKPSSRKRTSILSSASSHVPPPGFVVPGPDGQPMYAPINAYQGSLARETRTPPRPASRSASDTSHQGPTTPRGTPPRDVLGAFPGSEHAYRPASPPRQGRPIASRQATYERDLPPVSRTRSSSIQSARTIPFPVEPYQYHAFSPSSASPTSPQPQYARRVSSGPSEVSYTSMPRRVPVPTLAPAPLQRKTSTVDTQASQPDPSPVTQASALRVDAVDQMQETTKASGSGHGGERRRKSGKSRKKG
ncbi:PRA1-domain-containing protein, partial [Clathrospora elynae]